MSKVIPDRNTIIKAMYEGGKSYADIGRTFALSRQRIHQIVKRYSTYKNRNHSTPRCGICGSFSNLQTHHIDDNCRNNAPINLLSVCYHCHRKLHYLKGWSRGYVRCIVCGTTKIKHDSKGMCEKCYQDKKCKEIRELHRKEAGLDIPVPCARCGNMFVRGRQHRKFCSKECWDISKHEAHLQTMKRYQQRKRYALLHLKTS